MTPYVPEGARPYQVAAYHRIFEEFLDRGRRSTLLVLPTGSGKTYTFGMVARRVIAEHGRVLVLAHREELITQAANALAAFGIDAAIEKAAQSARDSLWGEPDCVIASVQTMQRKRLASWARGHFHLIVTDEAHHSPAESYQYIYDHLDAPWHLGVTATADRLDGENLGGIYDSLAYEYSLRQAIEEGWLSRLSIVRCATKVDLSKIRTTGGDLNTGDVEVAIAPYIEELANAVRQEIGTRRTLLFTPDVGSAQAFASALTSLNIPAGVISGDTRDRKEILDQFRRGAIRVLCNCQLLTEGFDAPFVQAIVLARPTKSRSLYAQMIGRGTRLYAGKKDCLIVDFAWLTGKHKLVDPVELVASPGLDPAVKDLAGVLLDSGECSDLMDAIEEADREIAEKAERRRLEVEAREREAHYRRFSYDPFAGPAELGLPVGKEPERHLARRPSEKQLALLLKWGIPGATEMSFNRANKTIEILMRRRDEKKTTYKQYMSLIKNGVDPAEAKAMSMSDASARLDVLFHGGGPSPPRPAGPPSPPRPAPPPPPRPAGPPRPAPASPPAPRQPQPGRNFIADDYDHALDNNF